MITAESPRRDRECQGCGGVKGKPMCADVSIGFTKGIVDATNGIIDESYVDFSLCTECGNDLVNALGFFVLSAKKEPPKRKMPRRQK